MTEAATIHDDILAQICAATRAGITRRKQHAPLETLQRQIAQLPQARSFIKALKESAAGFSLIAEIKRPTAQATADPSFHPGLLARMYAQAGATCLSVVTGSHSYGGSESDLTTAKAAVNLPILRKDFILEPYQVYESRALGADCILLVMAALSDGEANELYDLARALGMEALVEVRDRYELKRAHKLTPAMISINNRNLKTGAVDIETSLTLAREIPELCLKVCEGGIRDRKTADLLKTEGYQAFFIGDLLMTPDEIESILQALNTGRLTQTMN